MEKLITGQDIELISIINQIKRDLILSGIDVDEFEHISTANQLVSVLKNTVSVLLTRRYEDFNRFMYRIDIAENKLYRILHSDLSTLVDELCVLILKREIQKIVFKRQFGS